MIVVKNYEKLVSAGWLTTDFIYDDYINFVKNYVKLLSAITRCTVLFLLSFFSLYSLFFFFCLRRFGITSHAHRLLVIVFFLLFSSRRLITAWQ